VTLIGTRPAGEPSSASCAFAVPELLTRLRSSGSNNKTTGASANLLGKNYTKQVDVVVSAWETGPEVLISTKRMDSSFGNNAANRIEEPYGDLRPRRPHDSLHHATDSALAEWLPAGASSLTSVNPVDRRHSSKIHCYGSPARLFPNSNWCSKDRQWRTPAQHRARC
jgi:hypothetical protein